MSRRTVGEIIDLVQGQLVPVPLEQTVDTLKAGDYDMEVTGIAVTFMATMAVIKQAAALGANFIITHEPTFYDHMDETEWLGDSSVLAAKQQLIKETGVSIWRLHDYTHRCKPDMILAGIVKQLGWEAYQSETKEWLFEMPEQSLTELMAELKSKLAVPWVRYVGDPSLRFTRVAFGCGAAGAKRQVSVLNDGVEVLICGECSEWTTPEYARDALEAGEHKALIITGHQPSEEAGMAYFTEWLRQYIQGMGIVHIPAGYPMSYC